MGRISIKKSLFGDDAIIVRLEKSRLKFNTKISKPENCDVVVISNNTVQRLKSLDVNILNPKKKSFWPINKKDPQEYVIFLVDSAYHDASWGGHVQYIDQAVATKKRVNIRATFAFKIYRLDRAISLLSETNKKYTKKYLVDKLRLKIDNTIKSYVSEALENRGFIGAQGKILSIAERAQEKLNDDVLSVFGVSMFNLNIYLEEELSYTDEVVVVSQSPKQLEGAN